mmetsp:Transcript_9566/g.14401  ORF Transcript_9566/g.14401 Transcript_9566/m.14401 type:complete len:190 (+) Transcript_9566:183-752(+)
MLTDNESTPLSMRSREQPSQSRVDRHPGSATKGCMLHLLTALSCFVIISVTLIFLTEFFGLCMSLIQSWPGFEFGLKIYCCCFTIIVILIEMEWTSTARQSIICQSWIWRGLFYAFIGFLENSMHAGDDKTLPVEWALFVAATLMIVYGFIYAVMGLLNLKRLRDERMARYIQLLAYIEVDNAMRMEPA